MTADERIASVRVKIERANKHVVDLHAAIRAYFESEPYRVFPKPNPDKTGLIYGVGDVADVPTDVSVIAGDAFHNLRSALDHLMGHLLVVGGNRPNGPTKNDNFIVRDGANDFESSLNGVAKDLRPDAVEALRGLQPYKGGKGHAFWVLHRLDIIDKHRLLLTINSRLASVAMLHKNTSRASPTTLFEGVHVPLKAGDVLLRTYGNFPQDLQFAFDVSLNEPGVVEGKAVLETAKQLHDLVSGTLEAFKPCLA